MVTTQEKQKHAAISHFFEEEVGVVFFLYVKRLEKNRSQWRNEIRATIGTNFLQECVQDPIYRCSAGYFCFAIQFPSKYLHLVSICECFPTRRPLRPWLKTWWRRWNSMGELKDGTPVVYRLLLDGKPFLWLLSFYDLVVFLMKRKSFFFRCDIQYFVTDDWREGVILPAINKKRYQTFFEFVIAEWFQEIWLVLLLRTRDSYYHWSILIRSPLISFEVFNWRRLTAIKPNINPFWIDAANLL